MIRSIQDSVKKINSTISIYDCISLLLTSLVLMGYLVYIHINQAQDQEAVSYLENTGVSVVQASDSLDSRPFASTHGLTYTFNWCQGSKVISEKNKIIFGSESEALASGRTLSKLCQK